MEISITLLNLAYAAIGAVLTILFMIIGYKIFDGLTPFSTSRELADKNVAVGIVVGSIFIGLGIAVGLVIGMGLN
ncbi:MAG: DUF350 domain-containing protein [Desulfatiglans sp.]|jgi:uncharacterized membrane protein YjfL (UPF0719 family)|nr:DUF350 domain-containing protein [Thermodesulfobacteriota bacterium]MEE4352387.1 DUF350 domain-containing protein [Desulfatiglans sp.]